MSQAADTIITPKIRLEIPSMAPAGAFRVGDRPDVPHEAIRMLKRLRKEAELQVESLLAFLDEFDGDPDFEDGHDTEDDPAEMGIGDQGGLDFDLEPWLGSLEYPVARDVIRAADGRAYAFEYREDDQSGWGTDAGSDCERDAGDAPEEDPAESGIADLEGLAEQRFVISLAYA